MGLRLNWRIRNPDQYLLPFDGPFLRVVEVRPVKIYASRRLPEVDMDTTKRNIGEPDDYDVGVYFSCGGRSIVRFDGENPFTVLKVLKPRIGFQSALLLEMLGYRQLRDLARSGYCLSSIPSIGPKKTEKIIAVLEGFGLSPPRRPGPVPKQWQAIFDHCGQ